MRKPVLLFGLGAGFVAGSWVGRAPYEHLETGVRNVLKQPKVQTTLQTTADGAASVRDAALDAATGAIDDGSKAAAEAIDKAATEVIDETATRRGATETQKVASKAGSS